MARVQFSGKLYRDGLSGAFTWNAPSNFTVGNTVIIPLVTWPNSNADIAGVSVAGTAAELDAEHGDGDNVIQFWRAVVANSGRTDVVFSISSGTALYVTGAIEERDDILTSSNPVDASTQSFPSGATPSVSVTSTVNNAIIFAGYVDCNGQTDYTGISQPSGWTGSFTELDGQTHEGGVTSFKVAGAAGAQTATWTLTGGVLANGRGLAVSYKPATGGTTHSADQTEAATADESSTASKAAAASITESVTSGETSTTETAAGASRTEAVTAADSSDATVSAAFSFSMTPTINNLDASGFDVASRVTANATVRLLVTDATATQPNDAAFAASAETASATADTTFSIHHTGQ